jgi:hypothetical protein
MLRSGRQLPRTAVPAHRGAAFRPVPVAESSRHAEGEAGEQQKGEVFLQSDATLHDAELILQRVMKVARTFLIGPLELLARMA